MTKQEKIDYVSDTIIDQYGDFIFTHDDNDYDDDLEKDIKDTAKMIVEHIIGEKND